MKKKLTVGLLLTITILTALYTLLFSQKTSLVPDTSRNIVQDFQTPSKQKQLELKEAPYAYSLKGGYQTFQTFNNCGPASLSMALSYFGVEKSQEEIGNDLRPYQVVNGDNDDKSVTLEELAHEAEKMGFESYHRPGGDLDLIKKFVSYDLPVIARTRTKPTEDIGHYRVIKGYEGDYLIQDDSLQGKNLRYSQEDFNALWKTFGYEFLVIFPHEKREIVQTILGAREEEKYAWEKTLENAASRLSLNAGDIYAGLTSSVAYYHLGEYEKSAASYEKIASELPPRTLWYQIEPILAYQKLGLGEKVLTITDSILQGGNRAFSELYQIRGEVYRSMGEYQKAENEFAKVQLYNKNFFKYWN